MKGPRALGRSFCFAMAFAAFFTSAALAQSEFSVGPGGRQPIPDKSASPRTTDPQAYDAIDLFSRICVSTHGDRAQTEGIVGDGDAAIEKMEPALVRGLENGAEGGIGWIISMPLGDKILLELPATGGCLVRAPRVNTAQLEVAARVEMELHAIDAAVAWVGDVALPQILPDLPCIRNQHQAALRNAAIIDRRRITRAVEENADDTGAEDGSATRYGDHAIMALGEPKP